MWNELRKNICRIEKFIYIQLIYKNSEVWNVYYTILCTFTIGSDKLCLLIDQLWRLHCTCPSKYSAPPESTGPPAWISPKRTSTRSFDVLASESSFQRTTPPDITSAHFSQSGLNMKFKWLSNMAYMYMDVDRVFKNLLPTYLGVEALFICSSST